MSDNGEDTPTEEKNLLEILREKEAKCAALQAKMNSQRVLLAEMRKSVEVIKEIAILGGIGPIPRLNEVEVILAIFEN